MFGEMESYRHMLRFSVCQTEIYNNGKLCKFLFELLFQLTQNLYLKSKHTPLGSRKLAMCR